MPQEDGIIYPQQHELALMPQTRPTSRREGLGPAYQGFRPETQRAGYEYISRDGTSNTEALLLNQSQAAETGNDISRDDGEESVFGSRP